MGLPPDFPLEPYLRVQRLALSSRAPAMLKNEFTGAWIGLAHRYRACAESGERAAASLARGAPAGENLYEEERHLFSFFSFGVAVLESLAFGLFALGAMVRPGSFPLATPVDHRNATLGATLRVYGEVFHEEELTRLLFWHLNSREFGWWKEVRAVLSRRSMPGRRVSPDGRVVASGSEWRVSGVDMGPNTIALRREWLSAVTGELLAHAAEFAARRIAAGAE